MDFRIRVLVPLEKASKDSRIARKVYLARGALITSYDGGFRNQRVIGVGSVQDLFDVIDEVDARVFICHEIGNKVGSMMVNRGTHVLCGYAGKVRDVLEKARADIDEIFRQYKEEEEKRIRVEQALEKARRKMLTFEVVLSDAGVGLILPVGEKALTVEFRKERGIVKVWREAGKVGDFNGIETLVFSGGRIRGFGKFDIDEGSLFWRDHVWSVVGDVTLPLEMSGEVKDTLDMVRRYGWDGRNLEDLELKSLLKRLSDSLYGVLHSRYVEALVQ